MADGRSVQVIVDVVAPSAARASNTVKSEVKKLADEVKQINSQTTASAKQTDRVIAEATKQRVSAELAEEKRLERERKKIADDFIRSIKQVNSEVESESKKGSTALNGFFSGGGSASVLDFASKLGMVAAGAQAVASGIGTAISTVTSFIQTIYQAGAGVFNFVKQASDYGSTIKDFQDKTGLAAKTIQTLKFQAEQSGIAFDSLQTPISKFSKLLYEASQGSEKAQATLAKFGVTDFTNIDAGLAKVFAKIHDGGSETEKTGLAMEIFGTKTGAVMRAVADNVDGDLGRAIKRAQELGIVLSEEDVKAADNFGDTLGLLGLQAEVLGSKIGLQLAPYITRTMSSISAALAENQSRFESWGNGALSMVTGLANGFMALERAIRTSATGQFFTALSNQVLKFGSAVASVLPDIQVLIWAVKTLYKSGETSVNAPTSSSVSEGFQNSLTPKPRNYNFDVRDDMPKLGGGGGGGGGRVRTPKAPKSASIVDKFKAALAKVPAALKQQIISAAAGFGIPEAIALAQIYSESTFTADAKSPQGALGLTQGMPGTFGQKRFGGFTADQMKNPKNALTFWGKYMTYLYDRYKDWDLAVLAYHQGEGTVDKLVAALKSGKSGGGIIGPKGKEYLTKIRSLSGSLSGSSLVDDNLGITLKENNLGGVQGGRRGAEAAPFGANGAFILERLAKTMPGLAEAFQTIGRTVDEAAGAFDGLNANVVEIEGNFDLVDVKADNFINNLTSRLKELTNTLPSFHTSLAENLLSGMNGLADVFGQAAGSGKKFFSELKSGFTSLISSIVSDLARLAAQKFLTGIFSRILGIALPGVGGGGFDNLGFSPGGAGVPLLGGAGGGGGSSGGGGLLGTALQTGGSLIPKAIGGLGALFGLGGTAAAGVAIPGMAATAPGAIGLANAGGSSLLGSMGALFSNPWTAVAAGAAIGGFFLLKHFFGENAEKKLKKAAQSAYGVEIRDKNILKQLKTIGEGAFGKGQAGKHADEVVQIETAKDIIEQYAEQTGQNTDKLGRNDYGNENWKGNHFGTKFNGFDSPSVSSMVRSSIGSTSSDVSLSGSSSGSANSELKAALNGIVKFLAINSESIAAFTEKFSGVAPADLLIAHSSTIGAAVLKEADMNQSFTDSFDRKTGRFV